MKARTALTALVVLVALVFAGAFFGSPWLVSYQLMQAARQRDVPAVMSHVDLPAVRDSLKGQIDERLERSLAKRAAKRDPLAQLGALFGAAVIDKAIDTTVTPETIAEVVRTAKAPDPRKSALAPPPEADEGSSTGAAPAPKVKAGFAMTGLNRFDVRLSPADRPNERLTLVLHRRGLFDWKVTDVELPR